MRASVLRDARLGRRAGQFVWLSIDTEDPRSAAFVERFPQQVWPTFLVLDPRDGRVLARWAGGATLAEIERLLDRGGRAMRRADAVDAGPTSPAGVAALARVTAEQAAGRLESCAVIARQESARIARGPALAGVVAGGLSCALDAPPEATWRGAAIEALEPLVSAATAWRRLPADDRAALYEALVGARTARGDAAGARVIAERWWAFLESERRRGSSAEARAALDSYRVSAARALGDPARALPALAASERELPADYNPPARAARLLLDLGRFAEAREAAERALRKGYGPRKVRVYELAASIAEGGGDRTGAIALIDAAIAHVGALPPSQRNPRAVARLEERRRALEEVPTATPGGATR